MTVGTGETIMILREFISHYGFNDFCFKNTKQHVKIASSTPRANGQVERVNKTIINCLATSTKGIDCEEWDEKLLDVQFSINNSVHQVTRVTPSDLIFRYKTIAVNDNPLVREIKEVNSEVFGKNNSVDNRVEILLEENRNKMKNRFDLKRRKEVVYEVGDLVMVRAEAPSTGESRKLRPKYRQSQILN